ncbi:MAG: hypothetical protein LBV09_05380 [Deferribacteraceae bacterium]|jgi:hypothetical protein|nr:hypothetical protein [Deferribacteraceae bacterium]
MKKLLLVICMSLFVASAASALEVEIFGFYQFEADYIMNNSVGEGDDASDSAHYWTDLAIWGRLIVDPKTTITLRTYPLYSHKDGTSTADIDQGIIYLDRYFVTYKLLENLTFDIGRVTGNNYDNGFGGGWYDRSFDESGGRNQIKATYDMNENVQLFAIMEKFKENGNQVAYEIPAAYDKNGMDMNNYFLGMKYASGNLEVNPTLAYSNNVESHTALYGGYVSVGYFPESGFNFKGSAAFVTGTQGAAAWSYDEDTEVWNPNPAFEDQEYDFTAYGAYLDFSYVSDSFTAGALAAYASADTAEDDANNTYVNAFRFGGEFDKNFIIDDQLNYAGVPAMTMAQLYATCYPLDKVSVTISGAYYMSNVSDDDAIAAFADGYSFQEEGNDRGIVSDTTAYEFDLTADYEFTPSTWFSVGAGYAQFTDLGTGTTDANGKAEAFDPDPITMVYWGVLTEF